MANFEIVVSNIGTVYTGNDFNCATFEFQEWIAASKSGMGRVAGESVTLFSDGEILQEYEPPVKTLTLKYLDTCYPDYFQGFGGETFAIPVDSKMRNGEVLKELHSEISGWSGYCDGDQATEEDYASLHNSADELFSGCDLRKTFCSDAGDESYAYFGIVVDN